MSALRKSMTTSLAELRSRMLIRLVNRTFKVNPNLVDRIAIRMLGKMVGPVGEPDPDLEHEISS